MLLVSASTTDTAAPGMIAPVVSVTIPRMVPRPVPRAPLILPRGNGCMTPKARLLTEQRRRNVLDLVNQEGQITVTDLVKRFSISAVTVRSDLDALASIGAVVRSHGGAVRRLEATQDYPLRTKETLHRDEK